jgi:hypothetical protein
MLSSRHVVLTQLHICSAAAGDMLSRESALFLSLSVSLSFSLLSLSLSLSLSVAVVVVAIWSGLGTYSILIAMRASMGDLCHDEDRQKLGPLPTLPPLLPLPLPLPVTRCFRLCVTCLT